MGACGWRFVTKRYKKQEWVRFSFQYELRNAYIFKTLHFLMVH